MKYFTFVLTNNEPERIKDVFKDFLIKSNDPNIDALFRRNNTDFILYKSGKLLLRGANLSNQISFIKKVLGRKDYAAIGSDEVGTGDVFGPITVCAAYVTLDDIEYLESLNVRDSKSVNDKFIVKHAPAIAKRLDHSLIILDPVKYNTLVDQGYNMNKIKAHLHNQAIVSLHAKLKSIDVPIILDQFCQPQQYYNYLKDELLVNRDVIFHTKAENVHIAVAAAAIIARYAFLYSMQNCSKKVNMRLAKGASKKVDEQLEKIVAEHGTDKLEEVAKLNFRNVTKLTDL